MGRSPGAKNKPKDDTALELDGIPPREAKTAGQDVAIFTPARLPWHDAIEERFHIDKGQWKVLVEAIFPAAKSVDSIVMALSYCKSRGLDIMKRPIHIVPMWDSQRGGYTETVWPGISELRTTASRTKGYAGCDEAVFGPIVEGKFTGRVKRDGGWKEETVTVDYPMWCRITVYRVVNGERCKFVGPKVSWDETYATQGASNLPNKMWQERPEGQLEKCAEAAALRRAFPEEIGNELTAEEMIGRNVYDLSVDIPAVAEAAPAASRDVGPPRAIAPPLTEHPPADPEQARDGTPPPRQAKDDPISSGPPRRATPEKEETKPAPAKKPAEKSPEPFRIPGTGHTYESWADQYIDLLKTSPDTATVYKWIDVNSKPFKEGDGPEQVGPLTRLEKGKPSVYSTIRKATEQTMQKLRDAATKAQEKAAKKAAPPSDMDGIPSEDFDALTGGADGPAEAPTDPEAILKAIDTELAAVEDPDQLQLVWDQTCDSLVDKLEFPPDQDAAQAIFQKHEKRLGGD